MYYHGGCGVTEGSTLSSAYSHEYIYNLANFN